MKNLDKGYSKITMNVCNYCGFKAIEENDMINHIQEKHIYTNVGDK